jgi:predicted AlkP superfamily phosphohydrolase/phosphomutase
MIAIDGMDPGLLQQWMDEGRTPHLKALAERGGFIPLATSNPPQSPVAWSHFITGHDADGHGIYDFLHRDPDTRLPYLSTSRAEAPTLAFELGDLSIPLAGGGLVNLRKGEPFWHRLEAAGIPVTVVRIPADYPSQGCDDCPRTAPDSHVLSGMGTPDLLGTPGLFQFFTTDYRRANKKNPSGGRLHRLELGEDGIARGEIDGPPHPLSGSGRPLSLPVEIQIDAGAETALVTVGGTQRLMKVGEWTDWVPLAFPMGAPLGDVAGMVRLHLQTVAPHISLYASPVNIDPMDPAQPVSSPEGWAAEVAADVGRFYTQGMPEDTKALEAGVLAPDEFLDQSNLVFEERLRMLDRELKNFRGGFLFVYFSSIDLTSHMFFRGLDPASDPVEQELATSITAGYERVDGVVDRVQRALGDDVPLAVMSDHGFSPYEWKVNLNERLAASGFLAKKRGATTGAPMADIDWSRSRAYSVGLNLLFLNQAGRESSGVVTAAERDELLVEIENDLLAWRNPVNDEAVVTSVFRPDPAAHPDRTPDLIVGYNRTYRASEDSALGVLGTPMVQPNTGRWSGDHCMDPAHVPGVLLSSSALASEGGLTDLATSTLRWFSVDASGLPGENLFESAP